MVLPVINLSTLDELTGEGRSYAESQDIEPGGTMLPRVAAVAAAA